MKKIITLTSLLSVAFSNMFSQTLPTPPDHIIIVVEENYGYNDIVGSSNAPYLNSLIGQPNVALFNNSFGLTHPSQPNYLMLYCGTNNGVTNDNATSGTPWSICNLGSSIINAGKTWGAFSEDLPSVGFTGTTSGNYASKHAPWVNWQGTGTNQVPAATNMPYSDFPASTNYDSLPTVSFVIPNLADDMHNPPLLSFLAIPNGDTWLNTRLSSLVSWVKTHNSLLIITFDECDLSLTNQVFTMFIGQNVQSGTYSNYMTHYNILRTVEDFYTLPLCGNSDTATAITNCWIPASTVGVKENKFDNQLNIYPLPAIAKLTIEIKMDKKDNATLYLTDLAGRLLKEEELELYYGNNKFCINTENISEGIYFMKLEGENFSVCRKVIINNN